MPLFLLLLIISLACELPSVAVDSPAAMPTTPATQPVAALAVTRPAPSATATPAPTATPQPTATATRVQATAQARVIVKTVNMRVGPGTTFAVIGRLNENSLVTIIGKAPGDGWLLADTGQKQGWLAISFVELDAGALAKLPIAEVKGAFVITGSVVDDSGAPLAGITLAVTQGQGAEELRTDALTGPDGVFVAYLPERAAGTWTVGVVGIDCKSAIMDANCNYTGAFVPAAMQVNLPVPLPLAFRYHQ